MEKQPSNSDGISLGQEAGAALLPLWRRILLGDLTASLIHDLNNPLTAILNYARLLQMRHFSPEEIDEFAQNILTEGERMAVMTSRIRPLAASRAPEGRGAKLHEALTLALDLSKTRFRHDAIEIELPVGQNLPNTKLALADLLQMILPLLEQVRQALNGCAPESAKQLRCAINESENHRQRLTLTYNGAPSPANFFPALFPNSPTPAQIQIAETMTQALLHNCNCQLTVELPASGWTALHLDIPAES